MKTCVLLAVIVSLPALAFSATIYVPGNYPTIQDAIDADNRRIGQRTWKSTRS